MSSSNRQSDTVRSRRRLREWYRGPLGEMLIAEERRRLDAVLPNLFGYHLLQVGLLDSRHLLESSRIRHRMVLVDDDPGGDGGVSLRGSAEMLPFAAESLDVILLPHVLEFSAEPHTTLREAERVLIPEGHLVILGFNPLSLWGAWRLAGRWRATMPWSGRFITQARLRDWLALLGFDVVGSDSLFFRPPLNREAVMGRLAFLDRWGGSVRPRLGAVYLIVARKRVSTLTPIRPRWRPKRSLATAGIVGPAPRESP